MIYLAIAMIVYGLILLYFNYTVGELKKENKRIWKAIDEINEGSYLVKEKGDN